MHSTKPQKTSPGNTEIIPSLLSPNNTSPKQVANNHEKLDSINQQLAQVRKKIAESHKAKSVAPKPKLHHQATASTIGTESDHNTHHPHKKDPNKGFHHPRLEFILGEIVHSPYLVKPSDRYPKEIFEVPQRLNELRKKTNNLRKIPKEEIPFDIDTVRERFISEVAHFSVTYSIADAKKPSNSSLVPKSPSIRGIDSTNSADHSKAGETAAGTSSEPAGFELSTPKIPGFFYNTSYEEKDPDFLLPHEESITALSLLSASQPLLPLPSSAGPGTVSAAPSAQQAVSTDLSSSSGDRGEHHSNKQQRNSTNSLPQITQSHKGNKNSKGQPRSAGDKKQKKLQPLTKGTSSEQQLQQPAKRGPPTALLSSSSSSGKGSSGTAATAGAQQKKQRTGGTPTNLSLPAIVPSKGGALPSPLQQQQAQQQQPSSAVEPSVITTTSPRVTVAAAPAPLINNNNSNNNNTLDLVPIVGMRSISHNSFDSNNNNNSSANNRAQGATAGGGDGAIVGAAAASITYPMKPHSSDSGLQQQANNKQPEVIVGQQPSQYQGMTNWLAPSLPHLPFVSSPIPSLSSSTVNSSMVKRGPGPGQTVTRGPVVASVTTTEDEDTAAAEAALALAGCLVVKDQRTSKEDQTTAAMVVAAAIRDSHQHPPALPVVPVPAVPPAAAVVIKEVVEQNNNNYDEDFDEEEVVVTAAPAVAPVVHVAAAAEKKAQAVDEDDEYPFLEETEVVPAVVLAAGMTMPPEGAVEDYDQNDQDFVSEEVKKTSEKVGKVVEEDTGSLYDIDDFEENNNNKLDNNNKDIDIDNDSLYDLNFDEDNNNIASAPPPVAIAATASSSSTTAAATVVETAVDSNEISCPGAELSSRDIEALLMSFAQISYYYQPR